MKRLRVNSAAVAFFVACDPPANVPAEPDRNVNAAKDTQTTVVSLIKGKKQFRHSSGLQ